ncbi:MULTISPECIES: acyl-CoA dehydrogenase family protein [unclassified Streptomyces]|uniref:acyl-CoA dehydrogenase family protein n=1 Tax=unclassified Streptomyces TaxID=2593676 RepID=UPI002DD8B27A|nr:MULTISPECIES: acyl-CoA dehydrogenase family protein [unclassified Streptomyces]WSC46659.1 acyl-CoA/acyl-ACP dehydrogenase [Streptomyces sp. NBC_01762]WSD26311.1 acyl-CoA/acyl-ACP dehydrogenase [Streptomyces sp. NBC_01751]WSF85187.1 acyl-CoA/acyl-ACP dehydrogenase [Streptomyces sp. NBC_01744]
MDAAFTAEQDEIRRTLRELLVKRCGPGEVRSAVRTAHGYDEALWRQLAQDLGLPGLALAQEYGGVGCGPVELAVACEETGRALLPSPLLATAALAAPLIAALGTEAQRTALLPRITAGELTATLAVPGGSLSTALGLTGDTTGGAWAGGGRAGGVQARSGPEGWRLYGEAARVLDGHSAGLLLVAAHAGGFPRSRTLLFLVRADATTGLARTRQTSLDETRPLARIELRDTAAELLGADDAVDVAGRAGALAAVGRTAAAVLAAEAVGAAASALDRTVEYVKAREQFGRAIGSFQAVKHRLADLYVRVQAARSAAYYAAWDPAAGGLALAQALETLRITTAEAVQLHGGIGFTWEHEAHLYFKRAAADELLFGPVHRLRDHAAEQAGLFTQDTQGQGEGQGHGPRMEVAV